MSDEAKETLWQKYRRVVERTSVILGNSAGVGLGIIASFLFVSVMLRYVFNMPWLYSDEVVRYLNASVPVLGMAFCMKEHRHIRVDLVYAHLHGKVRAYYEVIAVWIGVIWCILLCMGAWQYWVGTILTGETTYGYARVRMWVPCLTLVIGTTALLLQTFIFAADHYREMFPHGFRGGGQP